VEDHRLWPLQASEIFRPQDHVGFVFGCTIIEMKDEGKKQHQDHICATTQEGVSVDRRQCGEGPIDTTSGAKHGKRHKE